jgi:hypothetical protein
MRAVPLSASTLDYRFVKETASRLLFLIQGYRMCSPGGQLLRLGSLISEIRLQFRGTSAPQTLH